MEKKTRAQEARALFRDHFTYNGRHPIGAYCIIHPKNGHVEGNTSYMYSDNYGDLVKEFTKEYCAMFPGE